MNLKRSLQALIRRAGYQVSAIRPPVPCPYLDVLDLLVQRSLAEGVSPYFVQIGANDGQTMDPLQQLIDRHGLSGLMVEPQPDAFARLRAHRGHQPNIRLENAVIASQPGTATLHVIRPGSALPEWLGQAASLDRRQLFAVLQQHLSNEGLPHTRADVDPFITTAELPAVSLPQLLDKHGITQIGLLVLDTMGFDAALLHQLPFAQIQPRIIQFEHKLLSREDHLACLQLLAKHDYSLCQVDMDTIAVHRAPSRHGSLELH